MPKISKNKIANFIIKLLEEDSPLPVSKREIGKFRYLDSGQIDSLNIMKFIFQIENKYKIKITDKDSSSDNFRYVDGLVNIIHKKLK